jgi:uncharacterized protein YyaL (SSP411 family)
MHTNKLIDETSPYLLQHAHNPVAWYPWGEEALHKAKVENKPILVSIGYAACHWCHVMERESFENEETAALMNEYFINIKIDREERPDLDHIYMDAVQAITGSGGWPLNVFLTPDAKPFFGGTYFPPKQAFNRISWSDVLKNIHSAFVNKRSEIDAQSEKLTSHLIKSNSFGVNSNNHLDSIFNAQNLQLIADKILENADTVWGGFGNAPKFPQTFSIQYLLRHYHFTKDENSLKQAELSLQKMIEGGIYDQIGGGFSRYSTDEKWLAPHFEKMLYDNALLIGVLSEAFQLTKNNLYSKIIEQTFQFITTQMLHEEGGFYSALDADSEGVEGKYYTWSKQEIEDLLGDDAELFCSYFDVTEEGNWEHSNILWVQQPLSEFSKKNNINADHLIQTLEKSKNKLFEARNLRIAPALDDKIILGWNALMITACCKAYAAMGEASYKSLAENCVAFLETKMQNDLGHWYHTYKNDIAKIPAFLDDYSYLIQAYIHLQEITGNKNYLLKAKQITEFVVENFSDEDQSFFYFTPSSQTDVIVRKKEIYDGATPSGNAVMAWNMQYLSIVFDKPEWKLRVQQKLEHIGNAIVKHPTSFGVWASVLQLAIQGVNELIIIGINCTEEIKLLLHYYLPNRIIQSSTEEDNFFPLLKNKSVAESVMYYHCKDFFCKKVTSDVVELIRLL